MNKMFLLLLIVIGIIFASCSGQKYKGSFGSKAATGKDLSTLKINLEVHKFVLPNGLRLLVSENHELPILSYMTFYNIGGRHESNAEGTTGTTHFLEHMMFKGAKKYGQGVFDTSIESAGGNTNAYTSFDNTVYYQNVPSHLLEKIVDMEADRLQHLALEPEAFENERQVVFEERKYRYENKPSGKLWLKTNQAVFEKTPYGGSVIGEVEDLKNLSREKMLEFFHKYYVPNNAVVVVVGDVDKDQVHDYFKKYFGNIPRSEAYEELAKRKDDPALYKHQGRYDREINLHADSPIPMFTFAFKGMPLGERKGFVGDILASILGSGNSSYLNQKYVKGKNPILNNISVSNYTQKFNGTFLISGELLKGISLNRVQSQIKRDMKKYCQESLNERNLQKTKNQYLVGYYNEIQTNSGLASFLGQRETFFGDYRFYEKELDIYESITLSEVKEVCEDIFIKDGKGIFVSVWDKHPKSKN